MTDKQYLQYTYWVARIFSQDPRTQIGAIIVDPKHDVVLASGANNFPADFHKIKPEILDRPLKYRYIEHAERNALFDAARRGIQTEGKILYASWGACLECTRAIIKAGIKTMISHDADFHYTTSSKHWLEDIKLSDELLKHAGIANIKFTGNLDIGYKILFDGKEVQP